MSIWKNVAYIAAGSALVIGAVVSMPAVREVFANGNTISDCPERAFGLYCLTDPSPVENPNLDCPERAFGLYCPQDPSPEENPNEGSSGNGDGGGGGGSEPEPPAEQLKKPRVLGAKNKCTVNAVRGKSGFIKNSTAPFVVEQLFQAVYGKKITHAQSKYWKTRARCDKPTLFELKSAMQWHKAHGSMGAK